MAKVNLDTVNPQDRDFQKFLKENNITAIPEESDFSIACDYLGNREDLEKMIDTHFFDSDLKQFIRE